MKTEAYSFDIFDTCITRTWARPTDLFLQLAARASSDGEAISPEFESQVANARISATDTLVRDRTRTSAIRLADIYEALDAHLIGDLSPDKLMQAELDLEREAARPILETRRLIADLRSKGFKIVFISDMYLPGGFLKKQLLRFEIAEEGDPVFVSGDVGVTKATGLLFTHVLEAEGLRASELHHVGDNQHSDVMVPRSKGSKATWFKPGDLNRFEREIITHPHSDIRAVSKISGISRAVRLMHEGKHPKLKGLANLAANGVAPIFTSYVAWVLAEAQKRNIRRLYFVSRDGQILLKIAERLALHMTNPPECRYLNGSRQSWFLPSLLTVDRQSVEWLIPREARITLRDVFNRLQLESHEIGPYLEELGIDAAILDRPFSDDTEPEFWKVLLMPKFAAYVSEKAEHARSQALAYFRQEGLCADEDWAIVDVGWFLNCQRALTLILQTAEQPTSVMGYYLGVRKEAHAISNVGDYRAFLQQDTCPLPPQNRIQEVFARACIIDQVLTVADHGMVVGYETRDDEMRPLMREPAFSSAYVEYADALFELVQSYADEIGAAGIPGRHLDEFRECALSAFVNMFARPDRDVAEVISTLRTSNDQNDARLRRVARPLTFSDLCRFAGQATNLCKERPFEKGFEWLEGSIALSNPLIRWAFAVFSRITSSRGIRHSVFLNRIVRMLR